MKATKLNQNRERESGRRMPGYIHRVVAVKDKLQPFVDESWFLIDVVCSRYRTAWVNDAVLGLVEAVLTWDMASKDGGKCLSFLPFAKSCIVWRVEHGLAWWERILVAIWKLAWWHKGKFYRQGGWWEEVGRPQAERVISSWSKDLET